MNMEKENVDSDCQFQQRTTQTIVLTSARHVTQEKRCMFRGGHISGVIAVIKKKKSSWVGLIPFPGPSSMHFLCNNCNNCNSPFNYPHPLNLKLEKDIASFPAASQQLQLCDLGLSTQPLCASGFSSGNGRQRKQLSQGLLQRTHM